MPEWTTACPDWAERIKNERSLIPFSPLFPAGAEAAMDIFRELKIVDAAGSPTFGQASKPWVLDFAAAIFGAYDHNTGKRLIREFFLTISKKNSKSTLAAGIMLTALLRNWRKSAEYLILAPTIEVANNSYYPVRDMIRADPELSEIFHVRDHIKTVTHRVTGATLKVVAADNETVSGKKATGVLIDELWLFGKRANAENMLREATGGLVSRPEGFIVYLTTQSDEPPAGVFKQKLDYFRDVRDGKVADKRSLPVIYEWPDDMLAGKAYLDPANFYVTNPNLGASVSVEWLRDELKKAQSAGPASLTGFAAKHLNVQIGNALRADGWPGAEDWDECIDPTLTLGELLARSEIVTIGVDYGGKDDLFSIAVLGRERSPEELRRRRWLAWSQSWCHEIALERRKSEAARYKDFIAAGELTVVERLGQDVDEAAAIIKRVYDTGLLARVGMDPNRVAPLLDAIEAAGMRDEGLVAAVTQGGVVGGAAITAERRLNERTLLHADQAIVSWAVGNAKVEQRGNYLLITKQAAGVAKIDPLMALLDAVYLMGLNPEPAGAAIPEIFAI